MHYQRDMQSSRIYSISRPNHDQTARSPCQNYPLLATIQTENVQDGQWYSSFSSNYVVEKYQFASHQETHGYGTAARQADVQPKHIQQVFPQQAL